MLWVSRTTKSMVKGLLLSLLVSTSVIATLIYPFYLSNRNNLWKEAGNYDWVTGVIDRSPQPGPALAHNIELETETPFGTYIPKTLNYIPSIIPTPIAPDLSNVGWDMEVFAWFSQEARDTLAEQGYLVTEGTRSIYETYKPSSPAEANAKYITTDLALHTYHRLFSMAMKFTEGVYLVNDFATMVVALRNHQIELSHLIVPSNVMNALRKNIAYLSTILVLLNDTYSIPIEVQGMVEDELDNIDNGVLAPSAIFGYSEDYSQYKVRGHYSLNEILSNYFQAMMYAGRMGFLFQYEFLSLAARREQTRMALLLVSSFNETVGDQQIWNYWERIYGTTSFFVGKSNDLTALDYYKLYKHYGYPELNDIAEEELINKVMSDLREAHYPRIITMLVDSSDLSGIPRGFRLFGQAFIPDSYMFQELVADKVQGRLMPKALDIMSVFGSERAVYLLQNESVYDNYDEQIIKLRNEYGDLTDYDWCQSLYWLQLYSILPLLQSNYTDYPGYMQNESWLDKSLTTALGSWAELRHDSILYAAQSYTALSAHNGVGYVEPYPELYARLSSLISLMRDGLAARNLLISDFEERLLETITICDRLTVISIKELENEAFTQNDIDFLEDVGYDLCLLVSFSDTIYQQWVDARYNRDALIADVHTDPNTGTVLEVGTGNSNFIYAIVQNHLGELRVVKGGIYSYYEFVQPYQSRLSDEEWHEMLDTTNPSMPDWILNSIPFLDNDVVFAQVRSIFFLKDAKKI